MLWSSEKVLCPFYKHQREAYMRMPAGGFCDNLRDGTPLCCVNGFFPDWDQEFEEACMTMSEAELRLKFPEHFVHVEYCGYVVRSDVYDAVKRGDCFFGGLCVRPKAFGFSGCTADCPRWSK
jgi:hypothetical protein